MVKLFDTLTQLPAGSVLHLCQATGDSEVQATASTWPPEIQQLLDAFPSLFATSTPLPPSRVCDHAIPLVPGASPTYSRPYRFAPAVKDEIER